MTPFVRASLACAALGLAASLAPIPAPAASGLAYDAVTKFSMGGGDGPAPAPGTFQADFQTASGTGTAAEEAPRGPFGLGKMMAKAKEAMAMFKNGTAEKHYVGINKERVDNVALQTAEITDCKARTLTHLDLAKKTYSVTSLDQPETTSPSGGHASRPGPEATDDGTKVAIDVTTKALGALTIEGLPTSGYDMNIKMTATKPSGETSTANMNLVAYYAAMAEPHFGCPSHRTSPTPPGSAGAQMASYALVMSALRTPKGDPRFTVTNSGPALPSGKLAMWQNMKMGDGDRGHGSFGVVTERGDIHAPIADTDAVFSIPAGFTKVDS